MYVNYTFSDTLLDADENCSNFTNDENGTDTTNENDEDIENLVSDHLDNQNENMHTRAGRASFSGLKSFCSTRWSCLLSLLKCHLSHFGGFKIISNETISIYFLFFADTIRTCLERSQLYSLIVNESDRKLMEKFVEILDVFNIFTKFVEGTKYTTINYMLLFYVDINDKLQKIASKSNGTIRDCAQILTKEIKNRFEITNDMLVAAVIDPWSQHIPYLNTLLQERNHTKMELLGGFCDENGIETNGIANRSNNSNAMSICSKSNSMLTNLFKKHTNTNQNGNNFNTLEQDIVEFEKIKIEFTEDSSVLKFWKNNSGKYPIMSKIAAAILCKMTSSSASENGFSTAGCVVNQKRSSLHPMKVEKILFIHHNMWITDICKSK